LLIFVGILLGGFELGLRAFPAELIPVGWLKRFQSDLRVEIAQQLSLPNEKQMWQLPRDDGGPPLKLYQPNVRTEQRFSADERSDVTLDAEGFCNPPRDSYERATIDVIIMGDSFTGCIATDREATWMSRIGQVTGLSVYNLGKGGIGPYEYLEILRYFGLPKTPTIVLMNIYEGNDLRDAVRYHEHVAAVRRGVTATPTRRSGTNPRSTMRPSWTIPSAAAATRPTSVWLRSAKRMKGSATPSRERPGRCVSS
jgi:hypothetical protein